MKLETIVLTLQDVIRNKQKYYEELIESGISKEELVLQYLKINIDELSKILHDLKQVE